MNKRMFLFITANKNEKREFLKKLKFPKEKIYNNGIIITYGKFGKYFVAHFHSPFQGNESLLPILNAIEFVMPDAVILVGIACGANVQKNTQKFGDVLISKNVIDFDFRKEGATSTEMRGVIVPSGNILYNIFEHRAYDWEIKYKLTYHCGDIISSSSLLNNPQKKKEIFSLYNNNPVGYEMEAIGAFRACRQYGINQWIIIKAISDFGDGNKKDQYQNIAAKNAVSLCYYVFSFEGLDLIPKVFACSQLSYDNDFRSEEENNIDELFQSSAEINNKSQETLSDDSIVSDDSKLDVSDEKDVNYNTIELLKNYADIFPKANNVSYNITINDISGDNISDSSQKNSFGFDNKINNITIKNMRN